MRKDLIYNIKLKFTRQCWSGRQCRCKSYFFVNLVHVGGWSCLAIYVLARIMTIYASLWELVCLTYANSERLRSLVRPFAAWVHTSGRMRGSRKVFQRGPTLRTFFSFMSGSKYHQYRAIIGLPAKRHLNGLSLACRCLPNIGWLDGFVIFQVIGTSIAKKLYIFVSFFFFGGGGVWTPCLPSGSAHGWTHINARA